MRHELPQFIDVEDKIFGPFTWKQFLYLAGGAGLCYALWAFLPTIIAIILIVPIAGLAVSLAFYKVNNRPFALFLQAMFSHGFKTKFYLWQHRTKKPDDSKKPDSAEPDLQHQQKESDFQDSKLRNISWSLDVLDMEDENANRDRK